jgi:hypothetical protein
MEARALKSVINGVLGLHKPQTKPIAKLHPRKVDMEDSKRSRDIAPAHGGANDVPKIQKQLLIHEPKLCYEIHDRGEVPTLALGELLVEIMAIGLNPIDWKSV